MSEQKPHELPEFAPQAPENDGAPQQAGAEQPAAQEAVQETEAPPVEAAEADAPGAETAEENEPVPAEAVPADPDAAGGDEAEEQDALPAVIPSDDERLALLEAIIYVAEEPLTTDQICGALALPREVVEADLTRLVEQYVAPHRGIEVRKVAGGYKMYTKAEHHEAVRGFVKSLQAKLKLSKPAFETLAVIAYKQPITVPEIQAIRGVNASGTIHTLLKHKLINSAGRKKVIGKPMMYKTTREFLVQFGLDDLTELPNLKEFEELSRAALGDDAPDESPVAEGSADDAAPAPEAELAAIEEEAAEQEDEPDAPESPESDGPGEEAETERRE